MKKLALLLLAAVSLVGTAAVASAQHGGYHDDASGPHHRVQHQRYYEDDGIVAPDEAMAVATARLVAAGEPGTAARRTTQFRTASASHTWAGMEPTGTLGTAAHQTTQFKAVAACPIVGTERSPYVLLASRAQAAMRRGNEDAADESFGIGAPGSSPQANRLRSCSLLNPELVHAGKCAGMLAFERIPGCQIGHRGRSGDTSRDTGSPSRPRPRSRRNRARSRRGSRRSAGCVRRCSCTWNSRSRQSLVLKKSPDAYDVLETPDRPRGR